MFPCNFFAFLRKEFSQNNSKDQLFVQCIEVIGNLVFIQYYLLKTKYLLLRICQYYFKVDNITILYEYNSPLLYIM